LRARQTASDFCTDPLRLGPTMVIAIHARQADKQSLNRIHRMVNVAHRCLYIVSRPAAYCNVKGSMDFQPPQGNHVGTLVGRKIRSRDSILSE
jgi:hypothetical protein